MLSVIKRKRGRNQCHLTLFFGIKRDSDDFTKQGSKLN